MLAVEQSKKDNYATFCIHCRSNKTVVQNITLTHVYCFLFIFDIHYNIYFLSTLYFLQDAGIKCSCKLGKTCTEHAESQGLIWHAPCEIYIGI